MDDASIDVAAPALETGAVRTPWSEFWRKFRRQPVALVAGAFVLALVALAVIAPWIVPYDAENVLRLRPAQRAAVVAASASASIRSGATSSVGS